MDKTDEQIAKERAAVDAMKNAKANMDAALQRIETLERALKSAGSSIVTLKSYIAPSAYQYPLNGKAVKCTDMADEAVAAITKVLTA